MAQKQIEGFPYIPTERAEAVILPFPQDSDPVHASRKAMAMDRLGTEEVQYVPRLGFIAIASRTEAEPPTPAA